MATWLGFASAGLALVGILITLYLRFFTALTVQGWSSILIVTLFIGGVQLISLGIIGGYLGRMFDEVRGRPLYLVSRKTGFGLDTPLRD
jgi:dolichol-phosphate mannosyltransferase